jgi:peptidoglycan/LPS O-acetylase OafA/YrhL
MPQLDGLRAFAVLAVLYTHYLPPSQWLFGIYWGEGGVRLFFVLSGFLITKLLRAARARVEAGSRTRAQALGGFYARRALRLVPAYYAVLGVTAAAGIPPVRETLLWHLTYLSNFYFVRHGGWDGPVSHLWTLAVEEQFYLVWSLVVVLAPARRLVAWIAAAILCGPIFRLTCASLAWPQIVSWVMMPGSLDSLGLGALLAWSTERAETSGRADRILRIAALTGLIAWIGLEKLCTRGAAATVRDVLSPTALAAFFVWLVARAARGFRGPAGRLLEWRPILYLGKISYGIYLIHNFSVPLLGLVFPRLALAPSVSQAAIAVPTTIGLAALSWRFLEKPFNRMKQRFA